MAGLDALMNPGSIAIIGASDDPRRIGGRPVAYLKRAGYAGRVLPINPSRKIVQELPALPSIADVDGPVDCAVVAVGAELVPDVIEDCAQMGVRSVVLLTGGFAELGAEGAAVQARIAVIARAAGMRVLGPNCIGAFNARARAYATFVTNTLEDPGERRSMALVSQSGGYASHLLQLARARDLPVGHLISTGNECDIELGEGLQWLAEAPGVDVIVGYVEGIRNRETFLAGLEAARRNRRPVIILKVGATEAGATAALSHTASLTGQDAAYDAALRRHGAYRAETTEEALDIAYAAVRGVLPADRRLLAFSASGGIAVQMADFAAKAGLETPPIPEAAQAELRRMLPASAPRNPVDTTAQTINQPELLEPVLELLLSQGGCASLVGFLGVGTPGAEQAWIEAVTRVRVRHPEKALAMCLTVPDPVLRGWQDGGWLVFEEPARAIRALAALARFREAFDAPPASGLVSSPPPATPALPPGASCSEVEGKAILAALGIPAPRETVAADAEHAAETAAAIGFPVAVKLVSPDIAHKTEVGGVSLGLRDAPSVVAAVRRMEAAVAVAAPGARREGWLVSQMVTDGVECLLGATRDPVLGPLVTVGLGGVAVELLRDVAVRLAPVDAAEAVGMLRELRGFPLLTGYRGRPPADVAALSRAVAALSRYAAAEPRLRSIEVNPLLVRPQGNGVVALDAALELHPASGEAP